MLIEIKPIFIFFLVLSAFSLSGCSTLRMYSGSKLPVEQVAYLERGDLAQLLFWFDEHRSINFFLTNKELEILPGKHIIKISSSKQKGYIGSYLLAFVARPGKRYIIKSEYVDKRLKHGVIEKETGISVSETLSAESSKSINLIPMYGYPREKAQEQKKADEEFIKTVIANSGTREKASMEFAGEGWRDRSKDDNANAMRRFNQSWLLNPDNYMPYWGFGAILTGQEKAAEAVIHYEKALSLINDDKEKPRLLVDTAKAYFTIARRSSNKVESEETFRKTNLLLSQAVKLDPQYGRSYQIWAFTHFEQGSYNKAWDMVKKYRSLGQQFNPKYIEALSNKMPEPR